MSAAAMGLGAVGTALGTAGNIAGGLISANGQMKPSEAIINSYDQYLNPAASAANLNIMSGLGFGNINDMPSVVQQLIGRMQSANIDEKGKRRAEKSLLQIQNRLAQGMSFEEAFKDSKNTGRLDQINTRLGLTRADVAKMFEQKKVQDADTEWLRSQDMDRINRDTVASRYQAANDASQLIGQASKYAQTGEAGGIVGLVKQQYDLQLKKLRDRAEMLQNFGMMPPGQAYGDISDATLNQNLRILEHSLGISGAIQNALAPATTAASGQNAQNLNAATIAAQQAAAANQLRAQVADNRASSLGSAISGAASSLGSGLGNLGLMSSMYGQTPTNPGLSSAGSGYGSSANNGINAWASGGGQMAPIGGFMGSGQ
jgi:hypothetical protein